MKKLILTLFLISSFQYLLAAVENVDVQSDTIFEQGSSSDSLIIEENEEGLSLDDFQEQNLSKKDKEKKKKENQISAKIGAIFIMENNVYEGASSNTHFTPYLDISFNRYYAKTDVEGHKFGYYFMQSARRRTSAYVEYNNDGYDVADMRSSYPYLKERDNELLFGVQFEMIPENFPNMIIGFNLAKNFGNSDGYKGRLFVLRDILYTEEFTITPQAYYLYMSDDYIDYYYGTDSNESPGVYSPKGSHKLGLALDFDYKMTPMFSFIGHVRYEFFSNEVSKSPLIKSDTKFSLGLGAAITF